MNAASLTETVALGTITGMRSMAGPAAVAARHGGLLKPVVAMLALAEMMADKTAAVPDRIDPLPLAGRAVMGAIVGGVIARRRRQHPLLGGLVGASAAVIAAHLAYRLRRELPLPNAVGGLIEDGIVMAVAARYLAD